jgi:plasmid stabilization system protein ParE
VAAKAVVWTRPAREDLLNTLGYLVRDAQAPAAAAHLLDEIEAAASSLQVFPDRGRFVPELGPPRRELLVKGYRLVYRVGAEVEILRLLHSRRDFAHAWRSGSRR